MLKQHFICLTLVCLTGFIPAQGEPKFVKIFNGMDLTGWVIKCVPSDNDKISSFSVEDSAIVIDIDNQGDYMWVYYDEKEYSDFHFKCRFQVNRGETGNSGVQIRSRYDHDDGNGWLNGPQIDINPPGPWRTGMVYDETRGYREFLYGSFTKQPTPDGFTFHFSDDEPSWNDFEIIAVGTAVKVILNGITLADEDLPILADQGHADLDVGMKGHFALQRHRKKSLNIRFRDIYVKDFTDTAAVASNHSIATKSHSGTGTVIYSIDGGKTAAPAESSPEKSGLYIMKKDGKKRLKAVVH